VAVGQPKVLIGFAEALAAIESAWCLRDAGFEVVAFTRAGQRPALAAARGVRIVELPAPESDATASVTALRALIAAERPAAVLPLDDPAVWLCDQAHAVRDDQALAPPDDRALAPPDDRALAPPDDRASAALDARASAAPDDRASAALDSRASAAPDCPEGFSVFRHGKGFAITAGPLGPQARLALDKREQVALAEKAGLLVPPTTAADEDPPGAGPWMVKCALAIVHHDGRLYRPAGAVATDKAEVPRIAATLNAPALVQPLLDGVGEGLFGFAAGGELIALSAHRRVRMMNPRGSGSSACRSIPVDPELVEPARRFLAEAGWHGIFMIELLRDDAGRPWFMELNGRTWGSMALARHRGLPYPEWAVRAALDPHWRPAPPPEAGHLLVRHLGRELVHLLAVMRGARGADAGRWPSRTATVRAMLRPERGTRWYHARRGELPVLLRDTWGTVASQVRRRG
jgi:hypothetical protein